MILIVSVLFIKILSSKIVLNFLNLSQANSDTMKHVGSLLDSTYLKTAKQASLSGVDNQQIVNELVQEAIAFNFKLVMIFLLKIYFLHL